MSSTLDGSEFERWRAQALSAKETAAFALAGGRHEWACFLSEQAAQLAVKGLLHGIGLPAWGHDLIVLSGRATDALGDAWPRDIRQPVARLSRHYIPTRDPDAHAAGAPGAHYTIADSELAARDCDQVLGAVDRAWAGLQGGR